MATFYDAIDEKLSEFICQQKMFFVATAAANGRVNLSPKGYQSLAILGPKRVLWLNLTGSGNETAAHLLAQNRMTLMFCSFEGPPRILRLYGQAKAFHPRDEDWSKLICHFDDLAGARQIFDMTIDSVQTSCGYGVPFFDFVGERDTLLKSAKKKGKDGLQNHWATRNHISIDGLDSGIADA